MNRAWRNDDDSLLPARSDEPDFWELLALVLVTIGITLTVIFVVATHLSV